MSGYIVNGAASAGYEVADVCRYHYPFGDCGICDYAVMKHITVCSGKIVSKVFGIYVADYKAVLLRIFFGDVLS